jgi:hypothetical protein
MTRRKFMAWLVVGAASLVVAAEGAANDKRQSGTGKPSASKPVNKAVGHQHRRIEDSLQDAGGEEPP